MVTAQQIAADTEDQAVSAPAPDEEQPAEAYAGQIVPFHTREAPGTIIIDTGERYLYLGEPNGRPSAVATASDVLAFNGRASSGCPRKRNGRTGACRRKWSDGSPIFLGLWRVVPATPSAPERSISVTPSSMRREPVSVFFCAG
jgi:lipoprotein-anchoring transpeptidase ErfK/SrfK